MKIKPKISPRLINSVSSIYDDVNRVIMEYVDNSFDSITNFNPLNGNITYNGKLCIDLEINGNSYSNGQIIITDNCSGIKDLSKVLSNIGNSNKKSQYWTNGQFGFGIYSFMAVCGKLEIMTKTNNNNPEHIVIKSEDFMIDDITKVKLHINNYPEVFSNNSGTRIVMSDFFINRWKEIDPERIKSEIESHFELILNECQNDIKITKGKRSYQCKAYKYSTSNEVMFKKVIPLTSSSTSTSYGNVTIFLEYTRGKELSRPPVFISTKRRVQNVSSLKAFDTDNKLAIWKHPMITGYIDTEGILNPTIARNNFKGDSNAKKLFKLIRQVEPEILEFIERNVSVSKRYNFEVIENAFNKKISQLDSKYSEKVELPVTRFSEVRISLDKSDPEVSCLLLSKNINISPKITGRTNGRDKTLSKSSPTDIFDDSTVENKNVKRKYGLKNMITIRIDGETLPPKNGIRSVRSQLAGKEVVIYKQHIDFMDRVKISMGKEIVSKDLLHYLTMEYLSHVCGLANEKNDSGLVKIEDFKDMVYKLDLSELEGQELSSFF